MTVRQMHGEAGQFPVTGQEAPRISSRQSRSLSSSVGVWCSSGRFAHCIGRTCERIKGGGGGGLPRQLPASPAAPVRDRSFKGVMSTVNATSAGPRRGSPRLRPSSLGERESGTAAGRGRRLPRSLKGIYPRARRLNGPEPRAAQTSRPRLNRIGRFKRKDPIAHWPECARISTPPWRRRSARFSPSRQDA